MSGASLNSMETVSIGLVGIAGYGGSHLSSIEACEAEGLADLIAVVVRPEDAEPDREDKLQARGVRTYRAVQEMLECEKAKIRLIALPTGIPSHADLSIAALNAGYCVLCEKPAAGSYDEASRMRETSRRTGNFLAIGFQHIYSVAVQSLKRLALDGELGRLLEVRALVLWPRDTQYYSRNGWAGKLMVGAKKVYDSPAQNAAAHYLNVMLYAAGASHAESARPVELYGENYRAQEIESADTQFIRITTNTGVGITFIGTHATDEQFGPEIHYIFERGVVEFLAAHERDGYLIRTGTDSQTDDRFPGATGVAHRGETFRNVIESISDGKQPLCTIENAIQHARCIQSLFEDACPVRQIDGEYTKAVEWGEDKGYINTVVPGVGEMCHRMFQTNMSFAEIGAPWAEPGRPVRIEIC